jgi:16S rRNA (cytidine1402-2'-O)-methyltransferase
MSVLFLVATPIGNLQDITPRALDILKTVHLIAAEDTRHTQKLLTHFDIHTPMVSYHEHNKYVRSDRLLEALQAGDVALVSDAGTPALNDPGYELVQAALQAGHQVSPIPGACAPIAALVASGLPTDAFLYLGYLPRKRPERRRFLSEVMPQAYTLIFLEVPHRLIESLKDLLEILGDRPMAVAREITKRYEEFVRGTTREVLNYFSEHAPRGEFTLVVGGRTINPEPWDEDRIRRILCERLTAQNSKPEPASRLAAQIATESGWSRRKVYQIVLNLQHKAKNDQPPENDFPQQHPKE